MPYRRDRLSSGTRSLAHRMSSKSSGCFANPSRIAGVLPSLPTKVQLLTVRKIVRCFCTLHRLYGEDPCQTALWPLEVPTGRSNALKQSACLS